MYAVHEVEQEVARHRIAAFRDGRKEGLLIGSVLGVAAGLGLAVLVAILISAATSPPRTESVTENLATHVIDQAAYGQIDRDIENAITAVYFARFNRRTGLESHDAVERVEFQMVDVRSALYGNCLIHPRDGEVYQLGLMHVGGVADSVEHHCADFGFGLSAATAATAATGSKQGEKQNQGKGECSHCCYSSMVEAMSIANFRGVVA